MPGPGPGTGRWYQPMPLYHGTGGTTACMCLCSGIALCIGRKFSVSSFWDDIRDSGSTAFVYVGETARYLLAQPESPRDKDHQCTMMFGNGLRPDVWKKFIDRFGIKVVVEFFNSSEGVFGLVNICKGTECPSCGQSTPSARLTDSISQATSLRHLSVITACSSAQC